jgi:ABC-type transport system involved in multi-copper enzyme maturation permease subunit
MKVVFNRTLTSMFKPLGSGIYYILVIISTILVSLSVILGDTYQSIEIQKINVTQIYVMLNFLWLSGILLNLKILITGTGLFAAEESSGTMRMLFARPLSRGSIIIGKILGLLVGGVIYMITSLIISIGLYSLITSIDRDVLVSLIKMLPSFILYGIFIITFFTGLSVMFSSLFKGRVPALIIMIVLVLLTFGIFPIGRLILSQFGKYDKFYIYYVDINSHIGNIYVDAIEKESKLKMSPQAQDSLGMFTGAYKFNTYDMDRENDNSYYNTPRYRNNLINTKYVIVIYSVIIIFSYALCYMRMNKKDIS